MPNRTEEMLARKIEVKSEIQARLALLSLPPMDVRVQVGPSHLTGTKVTVKLKGSEGRGEGPPQSAATAS